MELTARLRHSSFQCRECEQQQLSVLREESIEILRNFFSDVLKKTDYFHRLSYIDKLILLAVLLDNYQEKKPVVSSGSRINISGSENVDMTALSRLVNIGALVKIVDLPEEVALAETRLHESSVTTTSRSSRLRRAGHLHRTQRNQFAIERGIYFSLPLGFNNSAEFIEKIYNDIVSGGIAAHEVTDLKRMVIDMRIENFYRLIDHIAHDFNLDISNSVPLSALLSHLAERYPITKCYYTFHRYAKEVVLYMHKNEPPSYSRCHLFTKFVSNYIQNVEERGWELSFTRTLPEPVFTSNLEALVSRNFIDGHFNWHSLTATEVIDRWLSKITIHDSPAYLPAS